MGRNIENIYSSNQRFIGRLIVYGVENPETKAYRTETGAVQSVNEDEKTVLVSGTREPVRFDDIHGLA